MTSVIRMISTLCLAAAFVKNGWATSADVATYSAANCLSSVETYLEAHQAQGIEGQLEKSSVKCSADKAAMSFVMKGALIPYDGFCYAIDRNYAVDMKSAYSEEVSWIAKGSCNRFERRVQFFEMPVSTATKAWSLLEKCRCDYCRNELSVDAVEEIRDQFLQTIAQKPDGLEFRFYSTGNMTVLLKLSDKGRLVEIHRRLREGGYPP